MSHGTIRRLVKDRGFGFVTSGGGQDVFFHYSQLQGTKFGLLREGQSVSYRIGLGSKGFEAIDVRPSGSPLSHAVRV